MTLRIINKFLWLPKRDNKRWYWFRFVKIVQRKLTYEVIEWPLIPWGFGGPYRYSVEKWEYYGILDESRAIEVFVPNEDSPEAK